MSLGHPKASRKRSLFIHNEFPDLCQTPRLSSFLSEPIPETLSYQLLCELNGSQTVTVSLRGKRIFKAEQTVVVGTTKSLCSHRTGIY